MPSDQKPVIIIVHGAWHRPIHYLSLVTHLQAKGYTVRIPALTTAGWHDDVAEKTMADDVKVTRSVMSEYLDSGREIVILCHSFGGFSATGSAVGETVPERQARGQAGGVKAVVYIAAFAPPAPGLSLLKMVGLKLDDESHKPGFWAPKDGLARLEPIASKMLYSGNDDEVAEMSVNATAPQSLRSFEVPCAHATTELTIPKTYFLAANDKVIPAEAQKAMATAAGAEIIELSSGHCPFLHPGHLAAILSHVEKNVLGSAA